MKIEAALFDLDGTLHDKSATLALVARSQYESGQLAELGVNPERWASLFISMNNQRMEKTQVFAKLAQEFSLPPALEAALLYDFDSSLGKVAVPYPGALELLQACKDKGLKTGIITNGRDAFQRSKIEGMGLTSCLDAIFTSGGFGLKKPDHRIFLACLADLNVIAAKTLFVGDDLHADIEPSVKLGMGAVFKSTSHSALASFCSDSLYEISDFINRKI